MADPRFYDRLGPLTLNEIAALSGAAISVSAKGDLAVGEVAPASEAGPATLCYIESRKAMDTRSAPFDGVAVLAPAALEDALNERGAHVLVHPAARAAFARGLAGLFRPRALPSQDRIHSTARIAASARIAWSASIGAGAEIGDDVEIGPGAVIGPGCRIGAQGRVGAHATIMCADIGTGCNILAGAVIGEAGFGVAVSPDGLVDMPHLGTVEIGDSVTIGANSCVDRGLFGPTRIGEGTKIDNLCHIGHNCQVGRNVAMAAYAGVSGSCIIEDGVMFGGRVGVQDHLKVGAGARIGGNSALAEDVPAGETWMGDPAQPLRQYLRQVAEVRRLARAKGNKKKD